MIDQLQRIAQSIRVLKLPAILVGLGSLTTAVFALFASVSPTETNKFLIPSVVALLWALSTYAFIETFQSIPEKADKTLSYFGRLKRRLSRGWYWLVGVIFIGTSLAVLFVSYRLLFVWLT